MGICYENLARLMCTQHARANLGSRILFPPMSWMPVLKNVNGYIEIAYVSCQSG